jgi:hypothetical protein
LVPALALWDAWRENGEWFLQIGRLDIIIAPPERCAERCPEGENIRSVELGLTG